MMVCLNGNRPSGSHPALPVTPAQVPGTAGFRRVSTLTLDGEHQELGLVLRVPASRRVLYAA